MSSAFDLLEYIKYHPEIEKAPFGLDAIVPAMTMLLPESYKY